MGDHIRPVGPVPESCGATVAGDADAVSTMAPALSRGSQKSLLPGVSGVGLRTQHHRHVLSHSPEVAWFEAHTENYFADGGHAVESLLKIRERYPLSLHGVGLSLGSTDPLNLDHMRKLQRAVARFEPALVSEHLSWSSVGGRYANDLLPLPYTDEALRHVSERIAQTQDALGRQILIENPSSYLKFKQSTLTEWDFLAKLAEEAGCGILLDLNNIYVSAQNLGFSVQDYLNGISPGSVQEFHLAGHERVELESRSLLIDTHGAQVCDAVWDLYSLAVRRFGPIPALIEWDTDIPQFEVLEAEAATANARAERCALAA